MPVYQLDAGVLRIGLQRRAAARDEIDYPVELCVGEQPIRSGGAQLLQYRSAGKATTQRQRYEVLRQQIEWTIQRFATFDGAGTQGIARGGHLHQFERMRRYAHHA